MADGRKVLERMDEAQREAFLDLVEGKAWTLASQVQDFTGKEQKAIRDAERHARNDGKNPARMRKAVADRLYRRHHWDSLRWFLFGGYVDIPGLCSETSLPYDPESNPYVKVRVPGFVYTVDEHDEATPSKLLPDKDYLRLLAYTWVFRDMVAVPKSRQLMVSWLFCSVACHNLVARQSQRMALISKKEDDANALIERVKVIHDELPHGRLYVPPAKRIVNEMSCATTGSLIQAMNQEAKGLRSYTWSWVFSDETAFQDQSDEATTAALAAVRGGGRFTMVSTPDGEEHFHSIVSDGGRIEMQVGA